MRSLFPLLVLAFSACSSSPPTGTARQAASIGDACASDTDCDGLNGGCYDGTCRGGDGDLCVPDSGTFAGGPCYPGSYACSPCNLALYGSWECKCAHPGADGCEVDSDCPAGKACDGFGDCRAPCSSDADCASGEACPQEGLCIATATCAPNVCLPLSDACAAASCEPAECASLPVCGGP